MKNTKCKMQMQKQIRRLEAGRTPPRRDSDGCDGTTRMTTAFSFPRLAIALGPFFPKPTPPNNAHQLTNRYGVATEHIELLFHYILPILVPSPLLLILLPKSPPIHQSTLLPNSPLSPYEPQSLLHSCRPAGSSKTRPTPP